MNLDPLIHIAPLQNTRVRLQDFPFEVFGVIKSKSAWKKVIKNGWIQVDDKVGLTSTYIYGREQISFKPKEVESISKKLKLQLEVVFEDDYLAVINKPPGILTSGHTFKTVDRALEQNLKKSSQSDATIPHPVHRLDFETTGLLLVGKTSQSIIELNKLFEHKKIYKSYIAVTIGQMDREGVINERIECKPSISRYKVLDKVKSARFDCLNLVKLSPITGRRHQLRIHLSAIGNPILGDQKYGQEKLILKGKGLYLHAQSLQFRHPITGEEMKIRQEPPKNFYKIFDRLNTF